MFDCAMQKFRQKKMELETLCQSSHFVFRLVVARTKPFLQCGVLQFFSCFGFECLSRVLPKTNKEQSGQQGGQVSSFSPWEVLTQMPSTDMDQIVQTHQKRCQCWLQQFEQ